MTKTIFAEVDMEKIGNDLPKDGLTLEVIMMLSSNESWGGFMSCI
jgi:hypothetical protein